MPCVMIVEDQTILRDSLAVNLQAAGYRTLCASNGQEALERMRTDRPDLVLLDLVMPVMDGLKLLQILRKTPLLQRLPVIVMTGTPDRQQILRAVSLKVSGCVLKSVATFRELLSKIENCLRPSDASGADAVPASVAPASSAPAAAAAAPGSRARSPQAASGAAVATPQPPAEEISIPQLLTREQCLERAEKIMQAKTLSGVVAQVVSLAASPRGDVSQLASLISRDPMLSARVLNAANSAAYTSNRGVTSTIPDAVRQVGCSTVRNIATAMGIFDAMPTSEPGGFNPIRCWQHSFAVAQLCEQLSDSDDTGPAYLVGLCHDLGEILFHTAFSEEYAQVLEIHAKTGRRRDQLERMMLGLTHNDLVSKAIGGIGLPDTIRKPIEALLAAGDNPNDIRDPMSRLLRIANLYANGLLLAASEGSRVAPITKVQCRQATGKDDVDRPDAELFRNGIFSLTGLLARLSPAAERQFMSPLLSRRSVKVWLARDSALSNFDPIEAALSSLADVDVHDTLPAQGNLGDCGALVVVARTPTTVGFSAPEIDAALGGQGAKPTPLLWLTGTVPEPSTGKAPSIAPRSWYVSLKDLDTFVQAI